jgi:hypothetical protein
MMNCVWADISRSSFISRWMFGSSSGASTSSKMHVGLPDRY